MNYDAIKEGISQMVPFNSHIGVEIVEISDGRAVVRLPESAALKNHVGSQHAGALFSAGEAASGAAMLGAFAQQMGEITPLARTARIDYLKLASGPIEATANLVEHKDDIAKRLENDGKAQFAVDIQMVDTHGTKVAEMSVDWHMRKNT